MKSPRTYVLRLRICAQPGNVRKLDTYAHACSPLLRQARGDQSLTSQVLVATARAYRCRLVASGGQPVVQYVQGDLVIDWPGSGTALIPDSVVRTIGINNANVHLFIPTVGYINDFRDYPTTSQ